MLTFSNITDSSFTLVWHDPAAEDQNGIIRLYFINITEEETGRQFQLTSSAPHVLVEFLHPFYTYVCTVAASTVDIGPYSPPLTVTTQEAGMLFWLLMMKCVIVKNFNVLATTFPQFLQAHLSTSMLAA